MKPETKVKFGRTVLEVTPLAFWPAAFWPAAFWADLKTKGLLRQDAPPPA